MLFFIPIAFLSGILTILSPCVFPLLPIVLASGIDGNVRRIRGVIAGLITSFTIASLLLATIVRTLNIPVDIIRIVAVGLLVLFGMGLVFSTVWEKIQYWIEKHWHFRPMQSSGSGFWGGFGTGASLGIVWTPCVGPIVATMATLATISSFSPSMIFIIFAYALGVGIPLYFIAKGGSHLSQRFTFLKTENQKMRQVFGIIILTTALFVWTGADKRMQSWLLDALPQSWTQISTTFEKSFMDSKLDTITK